MTRTDPHRPSVMIPANYRFIAMSYPISVFDPGTGREVIETEWDETNEYKTLDSNVRAELEDDSTCDHCGVRIKYRVILMYVPMGSPIKVGHQCYEHRFAVERWQNTVADAARRAELRIKRERNIEAVKAIMVKPEALDWALTATGVALDIASKASQYGKLSEKQIAFLERKYELISNPVEEVLVPCLTGRIEIVGEVLSVKEYANEYARSQWDATVLKMTVKDNRGFKVWGTVPSSLLGEELLGIKVRFTATVEKSDRDETFGFFKRPTKAERV